MVSVEPAAADDRDSDTSVVEIGVDPTTLPAPTNAASLRARDILLNANKYALSTWWTSKYGSQGAATYLNLGGKNESHIRPPASEAYALAVSLWTDAYNPATTGVSQADAEAKTLTLIRSVAKAHSANTAGGWGRNCTSNNVWQSSLWAEMAGMAGWLMWDLLSSTDREYVRKMVECEANSLNNYAVPYYKDVNGTVVYTGDSKGEENSWNALVLQLAVSMMPKHTNWNKWQLKSAELMISAFATPADKAKLTERNGRSLADWVRGSNIEPDGSMINHSKVQPDYMATVNFNWNDYVKAQLSGRPALAAADWNGNLVYKAMSELSFSSPPHAAPGGTIYEVGSGDIYYPGGLDWGFFRREPFALLDVLADVYEFDDGLTNSASYWEQFHSQAQLDLQARGSDGRTYQAASEDTYLAREELVAWSAGIGYLAKWLEGNAPSTSSNDPLPSNGGVVVDDSDPGFSVVSGTWPASTPANDSQYLTAQRTHSGGTGTSRVRFTPNIPEAGWYRAYAWWGGTSGAASNARFEIKATGASAPSIVDLDQSENSRQWVYLGQFRLANGTGNTVELSDKANGAVAADAIRFDPIKASDAQCHFACQGFSSTQSGFRWTYQDQRSGTWTNIAGYSASGPYWRREPSWHDATPTVGGWVFSDAIHPGASVDTARTWSVPRSGVIDMRSWPAKIDPAGDGVIVRVEKNGTTVLGPRTISGSDTTGSPFNFTGLSVTSGDKIRFIINRNGTYNNDLTAWDPQLEYQAPADCRTACTQYRGTQGAFGWRYQDLRSGTWTDMSAYRANSPRPDGSAWHDASPSGGWIYRSYIHPGPSNKTARSWTAPKAGIVDIASRPFKVDPLGDGVIVQITKNGSVIAGPRTIAASDTTGSTMNLSSLSVAAGDKIRFEIDTNGTYNYDLTSWDPEILYQ